MRSYSYYNAAIVGAGITGLSAAYFLSQTAGSSCRIALLEKEGRAGGVIQTRQMNSFLVEAGPESFVSFKPGALQLCRELGLEKEILHPNAAHAKTFRLYKKRLIPIPPGRFPPFAFERSLRDKPRTAKKWEHIFVTLKSGLAALTEKLSEAIQSKSRLYLNTSVCKITRRGQAYDLETKQGRRFSADVVLLAVPDFVARQLLKALGAAGKDGPPVSYAAICVLTFGFRRQDVGHDLNGFGFLVSPAEKRVFTACTWSSSKWAGRAPIGKVLLRVYVPGRPEDEKLLMRQVLAELTPILDIKRPPELSAVHRHPDALPQYASGHKRSVLNLRRKISAFPGLFIAGAGYDGIGISDCIQSAKKAAAAVSAYLHGRQGFLQAIQKTSS